MFTGIVEQVGTVAEVSDNEVGRRVVLSAPGIGDLPIGASIAVNGVCLTAVETGTDTVAVDIIPESLQRSNLGALVRETQVNLERPMPATGRFDGHIVQGHVDGLGTVTDLERDADGGVVMTIETPEALRRYLVEKGSVTIDGVSLTVASLTGTGFRVALIPHTLQVSTLGLRRVGDRVNLEMDVLAKYVERLLEVRK
ncbi:MAG TPA: riboflavin synthase [Acidimicrobiia bacterium]|nr:riboflavin synthase [Acidimicrobiia bacterium]